MGYTVTENGLQSNRKWAVEQQKMGHALTKRMIFFFCHNLIHSNVVVTVKTNNVCICFTFRASSVTT